MCFNPINQQKTNKNNEHENENEQDTKTKRGPGRITKRITRNILKNASDVNNQGKTSISKTQAYNNNEHEWTRQKNETVNYHASENPNLKVN